jgi:hypothetical protein
MVGAPEDDLREAIAARRAFVVVGTGVSLAATQGAPTAGWQGLLRHGVQWCEALRPDLGAGWGRLRQQIDSGKARSLLAAAERVEKEIRKAGDGELRRWLREAVGGLEAKDREILDALTDLDLPIATTNYDSLLEEATGLPPVTWRSPEKVLEMLRGERRAILHLHGHWDEPESVVLGVRSYDGLRAQSPAQVLQQAMALYSSLVFVGCGAGLADPNLGALLDWLREHFSGAVHRHYRLALEGDLPALARQHRGSRVVAVPYGTDHGELASFLRGLAPKRSATTLPPPRPRFGRDALLEELVGAVLAEPSRPVPVVGGPGMGKSHLTIAALHDPRVMERFGARRFFVRCAGAGNAQALLSEVAHVVGARGGDLLPAVLSLLGTQSALLVLDNAETPWHGDEVGGTENLLARLAAVQGLALVASIRGAQRPVGLDWRAPVELDRLEADPCRGLFAHVAGERFLADSDLDPLLEALDRVPLAVELLAYQAQTDRRQLLWPVGDNYSGR